MVMATIKATIDQPTVRKGLLEIPRLAFLSRKGTKIKTPNKTVKNKIPKISPSKNKILADKNFKV